MVTDNLTVRFDPINCFIEGLIETIGLEEYEKLVHSFSNQKAQLKGKNQKRVEPIRRQMDQIYGTASARGIAICSGRAAFMHLLRQQEGELGFTSDSFRFAPGKIKLKKGLLLLADWMSDHFSESVRLENHENCWKLNFSSNEKGEPNRQSEALCDFKFGLLQGFLTWASGGKYYTVHEVSCRCAGNDTCCFRIDKAAVE